MGDTNPSLLFFEIPLPNAQTHFHSWFWTLFSQSQWLEPYFPGAKTSQSQFPFYPFRTLILKCAEPINISVLVIIYSTTDNNNYRDVKTWNETVNNPGEPLNYNLLRSEKEWGLQNRVHTVHNSIHLKISAKTSNDILLYSPN